jgi:hypothetical protein
MEPTDQVVDETTPVDEVIEVVEEAATGSGD